MSIKRRFARPTEPFSDTTAWICVESKSRPRVPLLHISYALRLSRKQVKTAYKSLLDETGQSSPVNCGDPDGYIYVSHLRALFSKLCPTWSNTSIEKALLCFDADRLYLTNEGEARISAVIKTNEKEEEDEEKEVPSAPRATTHKRKQPSPLHFGVDVPVEWEDAFRREMRSYMGINAIAAYRTQKAYKVACDAALVEDVTHQDKEDMRARVKEKLWADLYPAIKKRTKEDMLDMYRSNPEWEQRLQQQVAFRAFSQEGGGWRVE